MRSFIAILLFGYSIAAHSQTSDNYDVVRSRHHKTLDYYDPIDAKLREIDDGYKIAQRGKYEEALAFAASFAGDPAVVAAVDGLKGCVYAEQGVSDSAITYLQKAIARDEDNTWVSAWSHAYLGKTYLATGQKREASNELNKTIALHKNKASTDFAKLLLTSFKYAVISLPNGQSLDTAYALYRNGDYKKALYLALGLADFLVIDTNKLLDIDLLIGRIYTDVLMGDSAIVFLQKAIDIDQDKTYVSGWSHAYLGKAYLNLADKEKATEELNKAISLNKPERSARLAIQLLKDANINACQYPH